MSLAKLAEIRRQIGETKGRVADLETQTLTPPDVERVVKDRVAQWAAQVDSVYIGRSFATPGVPPDAGVFELACAGHDHKLGLLLAWLDPAALEKKLLALAKPYADRAAVPEGERKQLRRTLEGELYDLEMAEERLIVELEDAGVEVFRRSDADAAIVLAI